MNTTALPDEFDRRLIIATQAGLPLVPRPYDLLAEQLGVSAGLVKARLAAMLESGRIRRIVKKVYGWEDYTPNLSDEEILRRLLALNRERAKTAKA